MTKIYRCMQQHPNRPELSSFDTDSAFVAQDYRDLGWSILELDEDIAKHYPVLQISPDQIQAMNKPPIDLEHWRMKYAGDALKGLLSGRDHEVEITTRVVHMMSAVSFLFADAMIEQSKPKSA